MVLIFSGCCFNTLWPATEATKPCERQGRERREERQLLAFPQILRKKHDGADSYLHRQFDSTRHKINIKLCMTHGFSKMLVILMYLFVLKTLKTLT